MSLVNPVELWAMRRPGESPLASLTVGTNASGALCAAMAVQGPSGVPFNVVDRRTCETIEEAVTWSDECRGQMLARGFEDAATGCPS